MTVALTYCNYSVWQGKEMLCALVLSGGTPQVAEKREERSSRLVKKFSHFHLCICICICTWYVCLKDFMCLNGSICKMLLGSHASK